MLPGESSQSDQTEVLGDFRPGRAERLQERGGAGAAFSRTRGAGVRLRGKTSSSSLEAEPKGRRLERLRTANELRCKLRKSGPGVRVIKEGRLRFNDEGVRAGVLHRGGSCGAGVRSWELRH